MRSWARDGGSHATRCSFPLRFPHAEEPDDAGRHIGGSHLPEGQPHYHSSLRSRDRALLMLFLFSEVTEADAPTRIRVGSHLDVPRILEPYGEAGASFLEPGSQVAAASAHRPLAHATGAARRWSGRSAGACPWRTDPGGRSSGQDSGG